MKVKLLLLSILFFICKFVMSQNYPILDVDSNGTSIVILTEPQAQKLDSMLSELSVCDKYKEIIELQNKESIIFTNSDSICKRMLDEKDSIIITKDSIISTKDSIIETNVNKVENLNKQIDNYKELVKLSDKEIENKDKIIGIKDEEIGKWKKRTIGSWLASIGIIALILL